MGTDSEINSMSGCLARMFWIIIGPVLMLICAMVIALTPDVSFPGVLDIIYVSLLAVIIVARMFDRSPKAKPRELEGTAPADSTETASSEHKAGLDSALKYISTISFIAVGLWALAHFVIKKII